MPLDRLSKFFKLLCYFSDRRLADHFGGKLHLGYMQIRDKLAELQVGNLHLLSIIFALVFMYWGWWLGGTSKESCGIILAINNISFVFSLCHSSSNMHIALFFMCICIICMCLLFLAWSCIFFLAGGDSHEMFLIMWVILCYITLKFMDFFSNKRDFPSLLTVDMVNKVSFAMFVIWEFFWVLWMKCYMVWLSSLGHSFWVTDAGFRFFCH